MIITCRGFGVLTARPKRRRPGATDNHGKPHKGPRLQPTQLFAPLSWPPLAKPPPRPEPVMFSPEELMEILHRSDVLEGILNTKIAGPVEEHMRYVPMSSNTLASIIEHNPIAALKFQSTERCIYDVDKKRRAQTLSTINDTYVHKHKIDMENWHLRSSLTLNFWDMAISLQDLTELDPQCMMRLQSKYAKIKRSNKKSKQTKRTIEMKYPSK